MKDKLFAMCLLFDFYGEVLTEKQRELFDLYYNEDLSLAEISEHIGITRQGVRDSIKRAEGTLLQFEERLGLAQRFRLLQEGLEQIEACANAINFEAERYPSMGRAIMDKADKIVEITNRLY